MVKLLRNSRLIKLHNTAVQIKVFLALYQLKTKNSHYVRVWSIFKALEY